MSRVLVCAHCSRPIEMRGDRYRHVHDNSAFCVDGRGDAHAVEPADIEES